MLALCSASAHAVEYHVSPNGTYREWINPLSGGESDSKRILYRVAPGERAEVKGSEIVIGWKLAKGSKTVWTVTLPNSFFAGHIPFYKIGSTLPAAER